MLLRKVLGEDTKVVTVCNVAVAPDQIMTRDQYLADGGENPDLWCPFCFGS